MIEVKKVFISGPMTGLPNLNREAFNDAELSLKAAGFSVFNPAWLNVDSGFSDADIAAIDLAALKRCNYIYQLEGWDKSKGASAEWMVALWCGIKPVNKEWLDWYVGKGMPEAIAESHKARGNKVDQVFIDEFVAEADDKNKSAVMIKISRDLEEARRYKNA